MIKINIANDFSQTPGGRFINEGPYSGEEFREKVLFPKFNEAVEQGSKLEVNLDGGYGFPTSFLEEAFGGLVRKVGNKTPLNILEFISQDEPSLVEVIKKYMMDSL
ncbi:MAG: STAS-like domain-containing protein [Clostridium sp.]